MNLKNIRMIGISRTWIQKDPYYQGLISRSDQERPWNFKLLKRSFRTQVETEKYAKKVISRWCRLYQANRPRAKKLTRFS